MAIPSARGQLIINADDFGLTSGVNQAVMDCYQQGSVSSATLMVNTEATEEAAALARNNPNLGLGLHFNLTLGRPVSPSVEVPSLVDQSGNFYRRSRAEWRLLARGFRRQDILREFQAQLKRYLDSGLDLTHVDSHQHVHVLPGVFEMLASYCQEKGLPLRIPWVSPWSRKTSITRLLRTTLLKRLVSRNMKRWQSRICCNQGFSSVFDLAVPASALTVEHYHQLLSGIDRSPWEIMVHPARSDEQLRDLTRISEISSKEYEILSSLSLSSLAADCGLQVCTWGELSG